MSAEKKEREYTCALCGKVFTTARDEKLAIEEMLENFGDVPLEETEIVCDDCYHAITIGGKPISFN